MKRLSLMTFLVALTLVGCQSHNAWWGRKSGGSSHPAETSQEDHYSILLSVHADPVNHVRHASEYKKAIAEKLGWDGLFVIHKAGHSEVFWGRYRSPKKAQKNLKTAKAYHTADGIPLFAKAIVVPVPGKDIGPPEWSLKNVTAPYSLLVAVFKDDPERNYVGRRRFTVDYCRRLRKNNYEAYFHHGRTVSHVTIGAFGHEAATIKKGPRGSVLEIHDPAIKSLQRDFPLLAVNGAGVNDFIYDRQTKKHVRVPRKTYLIRVPRSEGGDGP